MRNTTSDSGPTLRNETTLLIGLSTSAGENDSLSDNWPAEKKQRLKCIHVRESFQLRRRVKAHIEVRKTDYICIVRCKLQDK